MGKWLRRIFTQYIAGVLLVITVSGGVTLLAWLQSTPWYLIALASIGAFGVTFWGINQFKIFRSGYKKPFVNWSNERTERTLREWLYRRGYQVHDASQPGALFAFEAKLHDIPITIVRLPKTEAFITLLGALSVDPEYQKHVQALPEVQRIKILQELRIEMARLGVGYSGIADPLNRVELSTEIACDRSLTEEALLRAVMFIIRGIILLRQLIKKEVSIASTPDTGGSQN